MATKWFWACSKFALPMVCTVNNPTSLPCPLIGITPTLAIPPNEVSPDLAGGIGFNPAMTAAARVDICACGVDAGRVGGGTVVGSCMERAEGDCDARRESGDAKYNARAIRESAISTASGRKLFDLLGEWKTGSGAVTSGRTDLGGLVGGGACSG